MTDKKKLKRLLDEGMNILDTLKKEGLDDIEDLHDDIKDIEDFINSSDAVINVEISFDYMTAHLTIEPHKKKGKPATVEEVNSIIDKLGIKYGIKSKMIEEAVKQANDGNRVGEVLIAQGKQYIPSVPGKYIYLYKKNNENKSITENGRIDYKEMNRILSVKKNEEIISYKEGVPGSDGIDLLGNVVKAPEIQSEELTPGTNVKYDEEKKVFIATEPGKVKIDSNNVVSVVKELIVEGNYDMHYGNMDFDGILIVNGNIEEGYKINVKGDILVKGSIYASDVHSDSDIIVEKGIITKKECSVSCKVSLECKFIENSNVFAINDVIVNGVILQSEVISLGNIKVVGDKGQILNSEVFAWKNVECEKAGSEMGLKTIICAGVNMIVQKEIELKNEKIKRLRKAYSMTADYLKKVLESIEDKSNVAVEVKKILSILSAKSKKIMKEIEDIKEDILEKEADVYNVSGFPSVKVQKEIFEGVSVQVGKAFTVNNSRSYGQKYIWDKSTNKVILSS